MEAMLRISRHSILISTSKNALFFLICLCLVFNKIREGQNRLCMRVRWGWREREGVGVNGGEVAQIMYAHMNK
jgi:hypothetical protein